MNIATVCYLPPESFELAHAFRNNLASFKSSHPVHCFSNDDSWNVKWRCPSPDQARSRNWFSLSNYVFICALCVADKIGLEYFLYLECDSRVRGDGWDGIIFDEHFAKPGRLVSGTPIIWNLHGNGNESLIRSIDYAKEFNDRAKFPMLTLGQGQPHQRPGVWLTVNGSVAVYHTETMKKMFANYHDPLRQALNMGAWDFEIGQHLWGAHKMNVFDLVHGLTCTYSGMTDAFFDEGQRREMLMNGKSAVHQIKSNWIPHV